MTERAERVKLRAVLRADAGRAAVAQLWCDGTKQKTIAKVFGYSNITTVCMAIEGLLRKYCPEYLTPKQPGYSALCINVYGEDRRALARLAVERYRAAP